jgi:hypothetical protein
MKIQEFRKLIREEIKAVMKESLSKKSLKEASVIEKLQVMPDVIGIKHDEAEGLLGAIKKKYQLAKIKTISSNDMAQVTLYKIGTTPYILADESDFGAIFNAADLNKVMSAVKDGSYFEYPAM